MREILSTLMSLMIPAYMPCVCLGVTEVLLANLTSYAPAPDAGHIGLHACYLLLTKFPGQFWYALHILVCNSNTAICKGTSKRASLCQG
jgi:hypothetical protein